MTKLKDTRDIWVIKPLENDLIAGARYAAVSMPWTFNRMMLNTGVAGQKARALNIAKGIVGQELLRRELTKRGIKVLLQRKSYRDDDLFDFKIMNNQEMVKIDLKTINYFTNYVDVGRKPFSEQLIIDNLGYPGPDWRNFFPMLVPHTQILQDKEAYCFAIASSIDFRQDNNTNRMGHIYTSFPHGLIMPFLSSKKLCLSREDKGRGFFVTCAWEPGFFDPEVIQFSIVGEWDGQPREMVLSLEKNIPIEVGPFSLIASFKIDPGNYCDWVTDTGIIKLEVTGNDFKIPILNASRRNINEAPDIIFIINKADFCNLMLPSDYTLYVIGWISKNDFIYSCRKYTGWVWPLDKVNKYENQPWSQVTERDKETLARVGFEDSICDKPRLLRAGWMKTTGRGGGSCCYVYPNIGYSGGVKETNLYVLPQDLNIMDTLGT